MKGEINFEFIISVSLFLVIVSYVSLSVVGLLPNYHLRSTENIGLSKSYQISEILLFDEGSFEWESGLETKIRPGLSNGTNYYLDQAKINKLQTLCDNENNYNDIKDSFNLDYRMSLYIQILDEDNIEILSCSREEDPNTSWFIERFGILNNEIVKIRVSVY